MSSGNSIKASTLQVSVIICTFNRCQDLRRTLQSICEVRLPEGLKWQILVVDNNSSDLTPKVCRDYQSQLPLQYIFEGQQGKSFALNTGVQKARGELILFTDDDVAVDSNWVAEMWSAFLRNPERVFLGGRVLPLWEQSPPEWIRLNFDELPLFPHLNWGDQEKTVDVFAGELFIGANYAFPRRVFEENHRFPVNIGFLESDARRGYRVSLEDTEFIRIIAKEGWRGVYVPTAIVYHWHALTRFTEKYMRNWYVGSGMALVRLEPSRLNANLIFGAPRYLWRMLVMNGIKFGFTRVFCNSKRWVPAECKLALIWGQIVEYRSERRGKRRKQGAEGGGEI